MPVDHVIYAAQGITHSCDTKGPDLSTFLGERAMQKWPLGLPGSSLSLYAFMRYWSNMPAIVNFQAQATLKPCLRNSVGTNLTKTGMMLLRA